MVSIDRQISPGPGDPKKKVPKKKTDSRAGNIIKNSVKMGFTIAVGGGGGFDLPADGAAIVVVAGGLAFAGIIYLYDKTDLTTTFRPHTEDPINYPQGVDNKKMPPNIGKWKWVAVGALTYELYEKYLEFKNKIKLPEKKISPQLNRAK